MSHEDLERRILEVAIDKSASSDPQTKMKARFARDVHVPILNWVYGEIKRAMAMPDRRAAHQHIAGMTMTLANGLGMAFGQSIRAYVLSGDPVPDEILAEALARALVEAFAKNFRQQDEETGK